jgi:3'-phosphoadenosine 5'-phosphosulfate sulfotransferase (PAPS reductase)/FAD synthetase
MSERPSGGDYQRAPGRPEEHPDWVLSLSAGVDSVAAALAAYDAIETSQAGGNFAKKPCAVYLDTRIGVPLNRLYAEEFCDWLGIQLWTLRTDEDFLEWLRRDGAPGAGAHQEVRNELKDRQVSLLTSKLDRPTFVLGISADESETRAGFDKVREMGRHTEIYPVHRLSRKERVEMILRSDCPRNPLWEMPDVITDCGCLANGDPKELEKTIEHFPAFGQRLKEWEESISHDGLKGMLGWDGLTADEKAAKRDGLEQSTLPMCAEGCTLERDPAEVRAFKARSRGATIGEAVSILYGEQPAAQKEVTAGAA